MMYKMEDFYMPNDMLVKLYNLKMDPELLDRLAKEGVSIHRALSPDRREILHQIENAFLENWGDSESRQRWLSECEVAFSHTPVTCYIASRGSEILGFACYNTTAKDYFGPTGVLKKERGKGIGKALLLSCLNSLREEGYAYAIIGAAAPTAVGFYQKNVGAEMIENSAPGVYRNML